MGYPAGQLELGWAYQKGIGVEVDLEEAVRWFRLAAERGEVQAQSELGQIYAEGTGVEASVDESEEWQRKAAMNGGTEEQLQFAVWYVHCFSLFLARCVGDNRAPMR